MREIKFRAWDSKYKIMRYGGDLFSSGVLHFQYYHPEEQGIEMGDAMRNLENPMQFTGLKDKNGKEIYEGDILFRKGGVGEKQFVVTWNDEECAFCCGTDSTTSIRYAITHNPIPYYIIGNIYENPDLL